MGKVLKVDLTAGTTAVEKIPDEVYEAVLSGKGLGAWYLYKNIPGQPVCQAHRLLCLYDIPHININR